MQLATGLATQKLVWGPQKSEKISLYKYKQEINSPKLPWKLSLSGKVLFLIYRLESCILSKIYALIYGTKDWTPREH